MSLNCKLATIMCKILLESLIHALLLLQETTPDPPTTAAAATVDPGWLTVLEWMLAVRCTARVPASPCLLDGTTDQVARTERTQPWLPALPAYLSQPDQEWVLLRWVVLIARFRSRQRERERQEAGLQDLSTPHTTGETTAEKSCLIPGVQGSLTFYFFFF